MAERCDVEVKMTAPELPTGSDRVWQAISEFPCDIVVNIQGDEPLIQASMLDALVEPLIKDSELEMSTLGRQISIEDLASQQTAKIILNSQHEAQYFSRFPIPYSRESASRRNDLSGCLKHIGIYAYRKNFLEKYCSHPPVELELLEGLEQLRALYLGARIRVVKVDYDSWGVDTPEDVKKIEDRMAMKARRS